MDGRPAAFLVRTPEGYRNLAALSRAGAWEHGRAGPRNTARSDAAGLTSTWREVAEQQRRAHRTHRAGDRADRRHSFAAATAPTPAACSTNGVTCSASGSPSRCSCTTRAGRKERSPVRSSSSPSDAGARGSSTHDPRYVDNDGRLVHDVLTALRYNVDLETATEGGLLHPNGEWRLLSPEEMARRWQGREEGIAKSLAHRRRVRRLRALAGCVRRCRISRVPRRHSDDDATCASASSIGAKERWGDTLSEAQVNQIEHELGVIDRLGFSGFFLVMWDAVRFAQTQGILCQGRGSAANSAVAYCLGITAVDPVQARPAVRALPLRDARRRQDRAAGHRRRLRARPARGSARLRVRQLRAGARGDHVHRRRCYRAPNAVQDAMRAFGYPVAAGDRVLEAAALRRAGGVPSRHARRSWRRRFDSTSTGHAAARCSTAHRGFEGLPRLRSTHVGGFVLSSEPLGDYMPIEQTTMGRTIVQFDKDDLDTDRRAEVRFPGTRRAVDGALRRSTRSSGARATRPQMYRCPPDDETTYDLISRGETIGTFQIESRAQIASILHTKPDRLYDIVVQVALIRPGPIQAKFVHPYTRATPRAGGGDLSASAARADSRAHAGHSDLPGAGDGDRDGARRIQRRRGRRAAPDDGPHAEEGEARGRAREARGAR